MKKILSFVLLFLTSFTLAYGKSVSVSTAKTVGYNFLHQKSGLLKSADDLRLVYTSKGASDYFYIFSGTDCFVLVSAEDGVIPIIGYATDRPFRGDRVPSVVTGFFENYNKQIHYVQTKKIVASAGIAANWDDLVNNRKMNVGARTTTVAPLLTTTWDQSPDGINPSAYYNDDCPYDVGAGTHCVTGCVATATAQVMKFWNWPATGAGIHSYATTSYGTLSANFGSTTYNWSSMPNNLTTHNPAVAKLMSDVGIGVNMNYSPTESSAYVISATSPIANCAEYALKTYFNYDPALHGLARAAYSDATWISMLEANLNAGQPIIYDGQGTSGGHCFVFDGYDVSDNFHVNWGWSGSDDGYYAINALNPPSLGTGGGAGGFNSDQEAIFGIKPAGGTIAPSTLILYDYVNLSASLIGYYNPFTVSTNIQNTGTSTFNGDFCAAAFDATTGAFVTFIDSVMSTSLPSTYVFTSDLSFPTTGLLAMLPGNYTIGIFYRPTGGTWVAVSNSGSYTNFAPMTVVNNNYMALYAAMTPSPAPFVKGSPGSVTLNIINNSTTTNFSGSYDVSLYNLDGTYNSTIQTMTGMSLAPGYVYTSLLTFSTASITANPGTYFLALEYNDGSGYALAGTGTFQNPIYVTVVAPPLSPDIYEPNNTAATAYDLSSTLTWVSNTANTGTPGSNYHIVTDQDYYKFTLAPGYNYAITARVNDVVHADDGLTYTVASIWSYSTDGGSTWSPVYTSSSPFTFNLSGGTGGTVIFHCSPQFAGDMGTYLLKVGNITRTPVTDVPSISLDAVKIYPNPAKDFVTIDLTNTGTKGNTAALTDIRGKEVYTVDISNQPVVSIPLNTLANGMYLLQLTTDAGIITKKITVNK